MTKLLASYSVSLNERLFDYENHHGEMCRILLGVDSNLTIEILDSLVTSILKFRARKREKPLEINLDLGAEHSFQPIDSGLDLKNIDKFTSDMLFRLSDEFGKKFKEYEARLKMIGSWITSECSVKDKIDNIRKLLV